MISKKKAVAAIALLLPMVLLGAGISKNNPRLLINNESIIKVVDYVGDLKAYRFSDGREIKVAKSAKKAFHDGKLTFLVPDELEGIRASAEQKADLFNVDAADSEAYYLNGLTGKDSAEVLCIFFFDYDKFLKYETDKGEMRAIERAMVSPIPVPS